MGPAFRPKLPDELAGVADKAKLGVVHMLTVENESRLESFFDR
jgi:hypothetical protein